MTIVNKIQQKMGTDNTSLSTKKKKPKKRQKTKLKMLAGNTLLGVMLGANLLGVDYIGDKTAECFLKCKRKKPKEYAIRKHRKIVSEIIKQKEIKQKKI